MGEATKHVPVAAWEKPADDPACPQINHVCYHIAMDDQNVSAQSANPNDTTTQSQQPSYAPAGGPHKEQAPLPSLQSSRLEEQDAIPELVTPSEKPPEVPPQLQRIGVTPTPPQHADPADPAMEHVQRTPASLSAQQPAKPSIYVPIPEEILAEALRLDRQSFVKRAFENTSMARKWLALLWLHAQKQADHAKKKGEERDPDLV